MILREKKHHFGTDLYLETPQTLLLLLLLMLMTRLDLGILALKELSSLFCTKSPQNYFDHLWQLCCILFSDLRWPCLPLGPQVRPPRPGLQKLPHGQPGVRQDRGLWTLAEDLPTGKYQSEENFGLCSSRMSVRPALKIPPAP